MSWANTIGVGLLTSLVGGVGAAFLTYWIEEWYGLRRSDGGDLLYFIVFVPFGIVCGLAIGILVSRWRGGGAALESLGAVLALCAVIGLVGWVGRTASPPADPERLVLQVEVKYPQGWEPDAAAKRKDGQNCKLEAAGSRGDGGPGTVWAGWVDWAAAKAKAQASGEWVVGCRSEIPTTGERQRVSVRLGSTVTAFEARIPGPSQKNWGAWAAAGHGGAQYRLRVLRAREQSDEDVAASNAVWEERDRRAAAMRPEDPMEKWLPLFDAPDGTPMAWRWGGAERPERKVVEPRALELVPLLESKDKNTRRQALFVVVAFNGHPAGLADAVEGAGTAVVEYIEAARAVAAAGGDEEAVAEAEKRARYCFAGWGAAMDVACPARGARSRQILEAIAKAAGESGLKGEVATVVKPEAESALRAGR